MSTRALACADAWIVELQQATGSIDLLTEKNCIDLANSMASCRALDHLQCRQEALLERWRCRSNDSRTRGVSTHYKTARKKDLAGASLEFDVRQKGINDAT